MPDKVVSVQLTGDEEVMRNLIKYADIYTKETREALKQEADLIMSESKKECPIDTGRLRSSAYVQAQNSGDVVVEMGYSDVDYAIYVHEDLTKYHHYPTKAKFLEDPLNRAAPELAGKICDRVKGAVT